MRSKIIYCADDGEEFEDKEKCEKHETFLKQLANLDAYDRYGGRITNLSPANADRVRIINIGSVYEAELVARLFDLRDFSRFACVGLWILSDKHPQNDFMPIKTYERNIIEPQYLAARQLEKELNKDKGAQS